MPLSQNAHSALYNDCNNLAPFDGELYLIKQFYRLPEADRLFAALETGLNWQEEAIVDPKKQTVV